MKKLLLFAFAACALAACSDDDGDSRVPATAVVLDYTEKELAVGETLQLTATPAPANTTDDVVWSSDAEEFATVSESGLVTAVAAGTAKISATYGSVSATCTVHVSEPDPEPDPDPNPDPEPEPSNLISFETSEGILLSTARLYSSATLPLAAVLRREITIMSFGRRAAATTIWP